MNGRMSLAVTALVASAAFAGCVESLGFLSTDDTEVTAMAHKDLVASAAAAWNPDAQLVAVATFENANLTDKFPADATVGNGRAPLWLYAYSANGTEFRAFQANAAGEVAAFDTQGAEAQVPMGMAQPITNWVIDSDRAVEVARANATFMEVASLEGVSFANALGAYEGFTAWAIMAGSPAGQAMAIISAVDGTLIMAQSFKMDFDMPPMPDMGVPMAGSAAWTGPQVEIEESGSLDASSPSAEFPFTLTRGDMAMLELTMEGMLPTDSLSWAVLDSEGEALERGRLRGNFMGGSGEMVSFPIEEAGDYELVLYYDGLPAVPLGGVEYELTFVVGPPCEMDGDWDDPGGAQQKAMACASASSGSP